MTSNQRAGGEPEHVSQPVDGDTVSKLDIDGRFKVGPVVEVTGIGKGFEEGNVNQFPVTTLLENVLVDEEEEGYNGEDQHESFDEVHRCFLCSWKLRV